MTKIDQVIIISTWIVVAYLCFQIGVMVGGQKMLMDVKSVSPEEVARIDNDISMTEAFMNMVNTSCREDRKSLEQDVKIWKQRYNELKEKESNDDGNDHSKCDCSLCY